MSFCREYCLLAVLGVRVRFWLFRGLAACFTVVCLFYAAVCALCAWFRWFTSFICHILSLSGGRRLCVCFFSALNRCFSYCLLSFACLDGLFYVICLSLPLIAHFFLYAFFARFVSCLSFFYIFFLSLNVVCCVLFFFCRVAAFLMERKRNCAGTVWRCLWGRALFACFSCGVLLLFIFALLGWCGGVFVRVN